MNSEENHVAHLFDNVACLFLAPRSGFVMASKLLLLLEPELQACCIMDELN